MEWTVDLTEIKALRSWYKKQPNMFRKATATMLNRFAWGTRDQSVVQIAKTMTVRNSSFVSGRLRVTQAKFSTPIDDQRSYAGSVATARFSGWTEQEIGSPTARNRFGTLASRGNNILNQMRQGVRLKPGVEVVKIEDYAPRGGDSNYGGFLSMLFRRKERKLVKIGKGFYKLPSNVKSLPGPMQNHPGMELHRELVLMQELKRKQPKRNRWLRQARAIYFGRTNLDDLWRSTLNRFMFPPPKR